MSRNHWTWFRVLTVVLLKNKILWVATPCRLTIATDLLKDRGAFETSVDVASVARDSSIGIVTRYGLDGPGIESRWGRDFPHPSRPALGPTHPPIQWAPGLSLG